jgi:hypothetical protein
MVYKLAKVTISAKVGRVLNIAGHPHLDRLPDEDLSAVSSPALNGAIKRSPRRGCRSAL